MKQCSKCGEWKEEGMFGKGENRCKACEVARQKEYYANNREKVAAQKKEYYANNREKVAARGKEYYANNWEKKAAQMKEYRANLKAQAYAVLGGFRCAVPGCNNNDPRGLNIDHVNGDGFLDRKKTRTGGPLYKKIIATGGAGYQVMCAYHNQIKRFEQDEALRQALKWEDVFGVQKVTAVLDVV